MEIVGEPRKLRNPRRAFVPLLQNLALAVCWALLGLSLEGCHLIFPFHTREAFGTHYSCSIDILDCKKTLNPPQIVVDNPPQQVDCYVAKDDFLVDQKAYCDKSWRIQSIAYAPLRGASRVITSLKDSENASAEYLKLRWQTDIDGVYVAYDSRAVSKPGWLQPPAYNRVEDASGKPFYITVAVPNQSLKVDLEIFENRNPPQANSPLSIPGNFAGSPSWPAGFDLHEALNYLVVIKPKLDCSQPSVHKTLNPVESLGCLDSEQAASQKATTECQHEIAAQLLTEHACGTPKCEKGDVCAEPNEVKQQTGLTMQHWSFVRHSEIEFNPSSYKSQATMSVWGNSYTKDVKGTLHFEYVLDSGGGIKRMKINSMILKVDSFSTDAGTFSDIFVTLLAPVEASCTDPSPPPWTWPCTGYQIPTDTFVAQENATIGSQKLVFVTQNASPVNITIDHTKRTFQIAGGPLSTQTTISDRAATIATQIDLTGHFLNFAPKASAVESMKFAECGLSRGKVAGNKIPIRLDGAGSFEIYNDPIPNKAYAWYEDFGLPTEKPLPVTGKQVILPPFTLGWGVHTITLALTDAAGVVSTDTFNLTVRDSLPPDLHVPSDRFAVAPHLGQVKVSIGDAWATDLCESAVEITNDAPAQLMFSPGVSEITWKAEDGRGNMSEGIQHVYVFEPLNRGEPIAAIKGLTTIVRAVKQSTARASNFLEACSPSRQCEEDLRSMIEVVEQAVADAQSLRLPKDSEPSRVGIVHSLQEVRAELAEMDRLLRESNQVEKRKSQLQDAVLESVRASERSMEEAARRLERLRGELERSK